MIMGRITEDPVIRDGFCRFEVRAEWVVTPDSIHFHHTFIQATLQVPRDSVLPSCGETWRLCGRLVRIRNQGNPGEVDYEAILARKNCWYRYYCDTMPGLNSRITLEREPSFGAIQIRKAVTANWEGPQEAISLLKAVCLGERSGMNSALVKSYSMAGGTHLLALSGLHVGLIWWALHRAFSILARFFRKELFRALPIILLLWLYAYVTGFSSSVCRSVTMFTLFSVSRIVFIRGHPVNVILVSMFLLLAVHPGWMLDVGFQLSYTAVLSIVTLFPILNRLIRPRNRLLRWTWESAVLSITAQVGTMPLVIYYFHQFPVYGLVTNLFAIPLLSAILFLFVLSVPLGIAGIGMGIVNRLMVMAAGWMNSIMGTVADLPGSVVGGLHLGPWNTLLAMILVFTTIASFYPKNRIPAYFVIFVLSAILLNTAKARYKLLNTAIVVVCHFNHSSLVTFTEGGCADHYIWSDDPRSVASVDRYIETAWELRSYLTSVFWVDAPVPGKGGEILKGEITACVPLKKGVWMVGNNRIKGTVVSGRMEYGEASLLSGIKTDFLLLSRNPRITASFWEDQSLDSCDIVADGSARGWDLHRIPLPTGKIHLTQQNGAYLKRY
jgi:competence protein ComEC